MLTTGLVGSEEVSVDTDECLRGAKASHGDNPNDELDSFLACVLARLDAVSFPCSRLLLSEFNPNVHPNRYRVCAKVFCKNCHLLCKLEVFEPSDEFNCDVSRFNVTTYQFLLAITQFLKT